MAHAFGFPVRSAGKSNIATEESRSNSSYGYLTTEDKVSGIVLPTDGLIVVAFQAMWKQSVSAAGAAALFIGANEAKIAVDTEAAPGTTAASPGTSTNTYKALVSSPDAILSGGGDATAYTGDVTTGQVLGVANGSSGLNKGGLVHIFAAAGTYEVGVKFKASSGSVTVKERKLWVWSMAFD